MKIPPVASNHSNANKPFLFTDNPNKVALCTFYLGVSCVASYALYFIASDVYSARDKISDFVQEIRQIKIDNFQDAQRVLKVSVLAVGVLTLCGFGVKKLVGCVLFGLKNTYHTLFPGKS